MLLRYLTHPQIRTDPAIPVPDWELNNLGHRRVARLAASDALAGTTTIVSSAERKAVETAEPLAKTLGVALHIRERMHENDRSATGFLQPDEFEKTADAFFASPDVSVRGWERAADAQARIVRECDAVLSSAPPGDILLVGHGGVGTLLFCHLAGVPIDRRYNQPAGGGNVFVARRDGASAPKGWVPMEELS